MRQLSVVFVVLASLLAAPAALAQTIVPPGSNPMLLPPPLARPMPPKAVPPSTSSSPSPSPSVPAPSVSTSRSFGDRVRSCLDEAAGAGLDPADRAAYSSSCAAAR